MVERKILSWFGIQPINLCNSFWSSRDDKHVQRWTIHDRSTHQLAVLAGGSLYGCGSPESPNQKRLMCIVLEDEKNPRMLRHGGGMFWPATCRLQSV